jgi:hypothetical protein
MMFILRKGVIPDRSCNRKFNFNFNAIFREGAFFLLERVKENQDRRVDK